MKFTALRPENPLAMMAAYGVLRLLPGTLIRWDGPCPEIDRDGDVIEALSALVPERASAPELTQLDDPRSKSVGGIDGYRQLAQMIPHEWLTAYAAETGTGVEATGLIAYAGNHKFVAAARKVMETLTRSDVSDRISEALLGPWRYQDKAGAALGWDPGARQDSAASGVEPDLKEKTSVLGANWLAWEAIPLWQMVNGATPGVVGANKRTGRNKRWRYPTSAEWLSWEGVRALVLGVERMRPEELRARRVAVWESEIIGRPEGGEFGLARILPYLP